MPDMNLAIALLLGSFAFLLLVKTPVSFALLAIFLFALFLTTLGKYVS